MDPLTMFVVASAAVSAGSTVWNYFAGQGQLEREKKRQQQIKELQDKQFKLQEGQLAKHQEFLLQQKSQAKESNNNQAKGLFDQANLAKVDTIKSVSGLQAGLAQNGIQGPGATDIVQSATDEGAASVDRQALSAKTGLDLSVKAQDLQFDQSQSSLDYQKNVLALDKTKSELGYQFNVEDLQSKADQFNTDFYTGLLGVGLTAGAQVIQSMDFSQRKAKTAAPGLTGFSLGPTLSPWGTYLPS